jgi:hypothetical protein
MRTSAHPLEADIPRRELEKQPALRSLSAGLILEFDWLQGFSSW